MKINKISVILLSILLLFAIIIAGILLWFFSPGVQHLFNWVHMDTGKTGYIFDENYEMLREAELCVKVNSFSPPSTAEQGNISLFELTGFNTLTSDDFVSVSTHELDNDILTVNITVPGAVEQPDGSFAPWTDATYLIYIDKDTSEILMCSARIFNEDNSYEDFYFAASKDPQIIKNTMVRAYLD